MNWIISNRFFWGFLVGLNFALAPPLILDAVNGTRTKSVEAIEKKTKGVFVNLINFPPVKPGKEAEFLEWFRWSNELYAKHKGFISRRLLKPTEGKSNYAAIVEHDSKETFMAMHLSKDREEAFKRVEPLLEGRPTPHFYEVVITHKK